MGVKSQNCLDWESLLTSLNLTKFCQVTTKPATQAGNKGCAEPAWRSWWGGSLPFRLWLSITTCVAAALTREAWLGVRLAPAYNAQGSTGGPGASPQLPATQLPSPPAALHAAPLSRTISPSTALWLLVLSSVFLAGALWCLWGAAFPGTPPPPRRAWPRGPDGGRVAQEEINAPGNAEGADGIEFLRAKMLFKLIFCINCSEMVCLRRIGLEQRKEGFCWILL